MRKFESEIISEFNEVIKGKDDLISLQERDIEALKREIKHLTYQVNRSKARKK